jgi:hypothetical protein
VKDKIADLVAKAKSTNKRSTGKAAKPKTEGGGE